MISCPGVAPPQNQRRREALADAAIAILGTSGIHALSHRAVDERAELPAGTAANYFPTRDELLAAAARRVLGLHVAAMEAADSQVAGAVGPDGLAELIGGALYDAAARRRTRYLAIYELTLEATRAAPRSRRRCQEWSPLPWTSPSASTARSGWTPPRRRCRR